MLPVSSDVPVHTSKTRRVYSRLLLMCPRVFRYVRTLFTACRVFTSVGQRRVRTATVQVLEQRRGRVRVSELRGLIFRG